MPRNTYLIEITEEFRGVTPETQQFLTTEITTPHTLKFKSGNHYVFRDGMVFLDDERPIYAAIANELSGDGVVHLVPTRIFDEVPPHPKGYTCGGCTEFDRATGRKELETSTNRFANGSYSILEEVARYTAIEAGSAPLTSLTVGTCKGDMMGETTPACEHYHALHPGLFKRIAKFFTGGR